MKQRSFRVGADLPASVRRLLLERFQPAYPRERLWSLTWAYGVDADYVFDPATTDCVLYALHTGPDTQSFLARLGGQELRPDGQLLHLTFCTQPDVAGGLPILIHPAAVQPIDHLGFATKLELRPKWRQPERPVGA